MLKKSISKSVRMTEEVFAFVDKFNGNGFNEKFENLVLFCLKEEINIDAALTSKRDELSKMTLVIQEKRTILNTLKRVEDSLTNLCRWNDL